MYAMITGFLPYMMEPFNVMEMYEKMMQRKMTPVPSFLSQGKIMECSKMSFLVKDILLNGFSTSKIIAFKLYSPLTFKV